MRQRIVKNREKIMEDCGRFIVEDPKSMKGHWHELFGNDRKICLEIGSGKGVFITENARRNPDCNYISCEGGYHIYPRIIQKADALQLENFKVISEYIYFPTEYFEDDELDGVFINFCDPWPKDKHGGRRLTYRDKLHAYSRIVKDGGFIAFKTDNDMLFDFSLGEFEYVGLEAERLTRDLHNSRWNAENIQTEYEQKFAGNGKSINYIRAIVKKPLPEYVPSYLPEELEEENQ